MYFSRNERENKMKCKCKNQRQVSKVFEFPETCVVSDVVTIKAQEKAVKIHCGNCGKLIAWVGV